MYVRIVKKNILVLKENYFSLKLFGIFSFKIDSTYYPRSGSGSKFAEILDLDPDPNSMYLDPQHCCRACLCMEYAY